MKYTIIIFTILISLLFAQGEEKSKKVDVKSEVVLLIGYEHEVVGDVIRVTSVYTFYLKDKKEIKHGTCYVWNLKNKRQKDKTFEMIVYEHGKVISSIIKSEVTSGG